MKHERGFVMPLVVILSFLFMGLVLHQSELLDNDRRFFHERKNIFHHETLIQKASVDLLPMLENIDTIENSLEYAEGMVTYTVTANDDRTVTVKFTTITDVNSQSNASITYDKQKRTIINWTE